VERNTFLRGRLNRLAADRAKSLVSASWPTSIRAWRKHGPETLERLSAERPTIYFKAIVMLAEIQQRRLPEPPGFDRQRYREDVMERLQERVKAARQG
jgi:hypothetical protein